MIQLQGSPPATEPNQGDTLRGTPALCQGYPGAILPAEGSTPSPIRVTPHGKQGAYTVGMGLSIIPSTGGLRWIEVEDSVRRSGRDDSAGKEVRTRRANARRRIRQGWYWTTRRKGRPTGSGRMVKVNGGHGQNKE
ncbi:hypothetical protein PoB_005583600 [Plakobranchus ocellatus]|uniref:Uncharacterized protein n=1 Tax=Plakobranchus ocellatus TaxID=259542 RepID=A0AAV4C9D2_9GAST|nr:hypothetical protein PoB_005583600 [Plakobranchus ocellatus]